MAATHDQMCPHVFTHTHTVNTQCNFSLALLCLLYLELQLAVSANCVSVPKVLDSLLEKSHSGYSPDWSLVETISELQMGNCKYTNAAFMTHRKASRDLLLLQLQLSSVLAGLLLGPSCPFIIMCWLMSQ